MQDIRQLTELVVLSFFNPSAKIFQVVKSITARELFKRYPEIKENYITENFGATEVMSVQLVRGLMLKSLEVT